MRNTSPKRSFEPEMSRHSSSGVSLTDCSTRGPRRHFGLRFMRERARLVGGTLDITSHVDGGTTVRLELDPRERS